MVGLQRYISTIWRTAYMYSNNKSSAVAEMGDRLATIDMGRKLGALSLFGQGSCAPPNTKSSGPRPACRVSFSSIQPFGGHNARTSQTDRQDRTGQDKTGQRSDSIGRNRLTDGRSKTISVSLLILSAVLHGLQVRFRRSAGD